MKDKLERFVRDHRDSFDVEEPSDALWSKIALQVADNKQNNLEHLMPNIRPTRRWIAVAAAICGLFVGVHWVVRNYAIVENPTIAMASPSMAKEVGQYNRIIEAKQVELRNLTNAEPMLYKEFSGELESLEQSYQSLKSELPENPNQEILIQAMIDNLKWQVDLLNRQLDIIRRMKQTKQNHENRKQILA